MKNKIIIALAALLISFSIAGYFLVKDYRFQKSEVERQRQNVEILNKNFTSYKSAYGQSSAKVEALNYRLDELKINEAKLLLLIKSLKIKPKDVISSTQIGTETKVVIRTVIQYVDSVKCLNFEDKYNKISGCFKGDSIDLSVETFDNLTTIVSKIPKHKFLWWTWGVKAITLDITAENPNTRFNYLKYIEVR